LFGTELAVDESWFKKHDKDQAHGKTLTQKNSKTAKDY
jgi:hypothetical protein